MHQPCLSEGAEITRRPEVLSVREGLITLFLCFELDLTDKWECLGAAI